ncbi:hypothetical protein INR49_009458 [Caranx melampygus]|nr:hypothetical protein INR49_009458 [Caranx melampygus]
MKETGVFLSGLVQELGGLRETSVQGLSALQAEQDQLEVQIRQAQERHQTGMKQTIQCLQDQLNLLTMETQKDYTDLRSASTALQKPLQSLQENISSGCRAVEQQASTRADLLSSTSSSLASSLRLNADECRQTLEEMTGCCSHLHRSVSGLVERDLQWSSRAREHTESRAHERLTMLGTVSTEAQGLQQSVESHCTEQLHRAEEELSCRQQEVKRALTAVQDQTGLDRIHLDQQRVEIQEQVEASQQLVHGFLQDELQQDVPTGATPQRRDFAYPRHLEKLRSRGELLESLRTQQEELQAAMQEEAEEEPEEEDKHSQVDHDSLEDELSTCNESLATEPSFIDENLVFNESKRVPFFKQKKGSKKESKIPSRSKVTENEAASTPQKSRLPLRSIGSDHHVYGSCLLPFHNSSLRLFLQSLRRKSGGVVVRSTRPPKKRKTRRYFIDLVLICKHGGTGFISASCFPAVRGLRSTAAQNKVVNLKFGSTISLTPDPSGSLTNILWKHNGNLVVEWVNNEMDVYGMFKGHTTLDTTTGRVDIQNPTEAFAGLYTVEINSRVQSKGYDVKFFKEITEVELVLRPLSCSHETETCELACGPVDTSGFGPLTYSWREDNGDWTKGDKNKKIINDDATKKIKTFSCRMENPVSEAESGSHDNPFYVEQPPGSNGGGLVGGILGLGLGLGLLLQ